MFRSLALGLAVAATACEKFPTPAELDHATVLAVIADPPIVAPGASSRLRVVAADRGGPLAPAVTWALTPAYPEVAPMGAVVANPDGSATYTAPDPVPARPPSVPPIDGVQATIAVDPPVVAVKLIGVQGGVTAANPVITDVTAGGASLLGGDGVIAAGATTPLAVTTDGAPDDAWTYAWYATAGTIDHYQSNPTDLVGGDSPGPAWIYVVVRDGRGGAAVRAVPVTVR